MPSEGKFEFGLSEIGSVLAGIVLTLVLHEATHGWVMQMFGARPQVWHYLERNDVLCHISRCAYHRNNFVVIALGALRLHKYAGCSRYVVIAGNVMGRLLGDMWNRQCEWSDWRYVDDDDHASLCSHRFCNR